MFLQESLRVNKSKKNGPIEDGSQIFMSKFSKESHFLLVFENVLCFFLELALLDVSKGEIKPIDVKGIPPIVFPTIETTTLQIQVGSDILACSEDSTDCQLWSEGGCQASFENT